MPADLRRARFAGSLLFLLFGMALGVWTARVPAVKDAAALTDGTLSVALLGLAAGAITGQQLAGRLVDRFGPLRVAAPTAVAEGVLLLPTALAPALASLTAALFVFGVNHGVLNIAMNAGALRTQQAYGRPIISSYHAVYSIGGFAGAALGGLCAHLTWSARATFLLTAALTLALAAWSLIWLRRAPLPTAPPTTASDRPAETPTDASPASSTPPAPGPIDRPASAQPDGPAPDGGSAPAGVAVTGGGAASGGPAAPLAGRPGGPAERGRGGALHGVWLLGVLAFSALVGEGAAADWSAVYLRDTLGGTAGFAAAGYAAFAVAMTAARLVGDRLTALLGPVRLVRASALLAAAGLGGALLLQHPVAGVAGFACLGAGLACIAPQVFSTASARNPANPGKALARVVSMGYAGFLAGPVLIGAATEAVPLSAALAVPVLLALFVALSAGALRPTKTGPAAV
ncbi:MFS transporter [Dactylosporangium sp. AC04546]|uniref:MFS transporter n=1 Tax=Dactylosporangium sp. AC04546 TaxID=2862460 RepID=UPI001EE06442|nr:MFS transporter [Dactylosporangium sp. AC04546]WVK86015.1 MFS transporter [Dactylosporangium sp. AC04546]